MKVLHRIAMIAEKEFREAAATPLFFILESIFILLSGYFFFLGIEYYSQLSEEWMALPDIQKQVLDVTQVLLPPLFGNLAILCLLFIPFLTMGTFANERKHGTLELLFTYPLRDGELIFGKWLGVSLMLIVLLFPLWIFPLIYFLMGGKISLITFAAAFMGLICLVSFFAAMGIFFSSLFESQTAVAVLTVGVLTFLWSLPSFEATPFFKVLPPLSVLSLQKYFNPFTRGLIHTQNALFFLLSSCFFLFLTFRVLEKRFFRNF